MPNFTRFPVIWTTVMRIFSPMTMCSLGRRLNTNMSSSFDTMVRVWVLPCTSGSPFTPDPPIFPKPSCQRLLLQQRQTTRVEAIVAGLGALHYFAHQALLQVVGIMSHWQNPVKSNFAEKPKSRKEKPKKTLRHNGACVLIVGEDSLSKAGRRGSLPIFRFRKGNRRICLNGRWNGSVIYRA